MGAWRKISNRKLSDIITDEYKEKLLEEIRQFVEKNGRVPRRNNFTSVNRFIKAFGGLSNAIKEAGFEPGRGGRKSYTKDECIDKIKQFVEDYGRIPQSRDLIGNPKYPSFGTLQNLFGSLSEAIEKAGFKPDKPYTKEDFQNAIIRFAEENGRPPREKDFINNPNYPGVNTFIEFFGTFNKALKSVGMDLDSMIIKGYRKSSQQKGRLFELDVKDHFIGESKDLSGENCKSPYDGICPTGKIYDAKSARLIGGKWQINLKNVYKTKIQWWYLGLFDKNFEELLYVLRIPSSDLEDDIKKEFMLIFMEEDHKYTIENMKKYNISEKFRGCKNPMVDNIDDDNDDDDGYIKMVQS